MEACTAAAAADSRIQRFSGLFQRPRLPSLALILAAVLEVLITL